MNYLPDIDLRSQLRAAIKTETDECVRYTLDFAAKGLDRAYRDFRLNPHGDHLTVLNGAWVNAVKVLKVAGQQKQPKEMA